jgi:hypothetical protein
MRLGDDQDCSFRAKATVEERTIEYSIPPPPGVIVGAYDMCALWAFDEISRPRSFPKDMIEVCKVWQNRPPDREVVKVFNIQSQLSSEEVRLDRSRQVSDIADCRVR